MAMSEVQPDQHDLLMAHSMGYRMSASNVIVDGVDKLDFELYPYIPEILDTRTPLITVIKGAQMGFTIGFVIKGLEEAKSGNHRGIGYYFPTQDEVSDFARARFGPMMEDNYELWGRYVENTDSAGLKKIGKTHLYFRGVGQRGSGAVGKSTSKLKSIPNDIQILDEKDEMDPGRLAAVGHRMDAVRPGFIPMQWRLSTPTLPGYGVDQDYKESDQRVWMIKCEACGDWTCLDLTYPDCIAEPANKEAYFMCEHCRKRLKPVKQDWVARKPDLSKDHRGFWISQLGAMRKPAQFFIDALLKAQADGTEHEMQNQNLARAFAYTDQEITDEQLRAALTKEPKPLRHEGPAVLGCDPGKPNWYTVKVRLSEEDSMCLDMGKVHSLEELDRVWKKYNCEAGVIDKGYDPTAVDNFCQEHSGCYGALYIGGKTTSPDWNHKEREVKVGRTATLDQAHRNIINGRSKYCQQGAFWNEQFVPQMKNLKRANHIINQRTGEERADWVVTGGKKNDHLRHADGYADLALKRVGLVKSIQAVATRAERQGKASRSRRRSVMSL